MNSIKQSITKINSTFMTEQGTSLKPQHFFLTDKPISRISTALIGAENNVLLRIIVYTIFSIVSIFPSCSNINAVQKSSFIEFKKQPFKI